MDETKTLLLPEGIRNLKKNITERLERVALVMELLLEHKAGPAVPGRCEW